MSIPLISSFLLSKLSTYDIVRIIACSLISTILIFFILIFSITPPRPSALFMRTPTSVPRKVQFSTSTFLIPRLISLPITKPPCPLLTRQSWIYTSSQGPSICLATAFLPDFKQIASSPVSNVQLWI